MVQDLSDEIRECYRHAEYCRRRADEATDPGTKEHYLAMEQRWLGLARGYAFAEKLSRFTDPFSKRKQRTDRPSGRYDRGGAKQPRPGVRPPRRLRTSPYESG